MKLVSFNMRGVGSIAKQRRFRSLVIREKFDMCFIQETKRKEIDTSIVSRMWGGDDVEWIAQPSDGLSGGILTCWRKGILSVLFSFSQTGYVGVAAQIEGRLFYFVNVYSGCSARRKRDLWASLIRDKVRLNPGVWVIGGTLTL